MMTRQGMNPCDPDILTSYVDGALSEAESRRVAAHLDACPSCEEIVRSHRDVKQRLARSAALIAAPIDLSARVTGALDKVSAPHTGGSRWGNGGGPAGIAKLGLPLGLVTLITAGGLWFSRPLWRPEPVDVRALMWHHRDAINPPAGASLRTTDEVQGRQWLQTRLGNVSAAPRLSARLRGVGVCTVDGAPSAIWMYDAGRPVSLIEIQRTDQLPAWSPAPMPAMPGRGPACPQGMVAGTYGGYNAVIWQTGGRTFALVSELPPDRLTRLLESRP